MMLAGASLKVALATVHMPLKRAAETLDADAIIRVATVLDAALRQDFGISRPRIALAGLNPHAGEGGALGREEIEIINPAAAALRARGIAATDAQPPDTLFHDEARAGYDAVIAMYHDQGLIPLKTLHFWDGVNLTLGLPIVRTSPDHGTAFDIAGRNLARADSLIAALTMAGQIAARRAAPVASRGAGWARSRRVAPCAPHKACARKKSSASISCSILRSMHASPPPPM
jgi:4-hydroxythreonine-4-phosphate dehydrogenase